MSLGPFRVGDRPVAALDIDISRGGYQTPITGFTSSTVTLAKPDGTTQVLNSIIDGDSIIVDWPSGASAFTLVGLYTIQAVLNGTNVREAVTPIAFQVLALTTASKGWASVADVKATTNVDVSEQSLTQAQIQVEIATGLVAAETYLNNVVPLTGQTVALSSRDSYFLKLGVAYQAAWLETQPDLYMRNDVTSVSQDGASVTYTDTGLILAPLARKSLDRLSWLGTRSVRVNSGSVTSAFLLERWDDIGDWRPL